jgi:hypothetical protein
VPRRGPWVPPPPRRRRMGACALTGAVSVMWVTVRSRARRSCLLCNAVEPGERPKLPDDFTVTIDDKGRRH